MGAPQPTNVENAIVRGLADYLRALPAVQAILAASSWPSPDNAPDGQVLEQWPDASRALRFPTISVTAGTASLEQHPPYLWRILMPSGADPLAVASAGAALSGGAVTPEGLAAMGAVVPFPPGIDPATGPIGYYALGDLTVPVQVDVWARTKFQREAVANVVVASLQPDPEWGSGLDLFLPDYHGEIASFDFQDDDRPDSEPNATENHWRSIVTLQAGTKKIVAQNVSLMEVLRLRSQIGPQPSLVPQEERVVFE